VTHFIFWSQSIWSIRENIPVTLAQCSRNNSLTGPFLLKYDISISLDSWREVMEEVATSLQNHGYPYVYHGGCDTPSSSDLKPSTVGDGRMDCHFRLYSFGHAGDQNLHLNVLLRCDHFLSLFPPPPPSSHCRSIAFAQREMAMTIFLKNIVVIGRVLPRCHSSSLSPILSLLPPPPPPRSPSRVTSMVLSSTP
jgi:hypothetical protein